MKHVLLALLMGTALSTSAIAADVNGGMKDEPRGFMAPEARSSEFNWTRAWGFIGGGYGMTNTEIELAEKGEPNFPVIDGLGAEGIFGEVQVGVDKQVGDLVFGLFVGAGYSDATFAIIGTDLINQNESYFGGLRVGALINPGTLVYVAGGYRTTHFEMEATPLGSGGDEFVDGLFGETGIEGRLNETVGWKAFGRYTLYDDAKIGGSEDWHLNASPSELQFGAGLTISVGSPVEKLF